jgi:hypothetical protein
MQHTIAVLALAVGFLAAPTFAAVAMDGCPPCCPQPANAPCETGEAPCVSVAVASCCDAPPPASEAKRSIDAPNFQPVATMARTSAPVPRRAAPVRSGADLALLTSPLRLSVVLLI